LGETREATEEVVTWDDGDGYDICFGVGKSRRYHGSMREFYRWCHDLSLALAAVAGSAAFFALWPANANVWLLRGLTFVVTVATSCDLVFNFSKKADLHDALCRRFTELAAKMAEWPATAANIDAARAERIRIEADEPTERRLIDLRAHNDELSARGIPPNRLLPLGFWQGSVLAYVFTFSLKDIRKRMADRDALSANASGAP